MPEQSTDFREALSAGAAHRDEALAQLPEPVAAYIRAHGLYAAERGA